MAIGESKAGFFIRTPLSKMISFSFFFKQIISEIDEKSALKEHLKISVKKTPSGVLF